VSENLTWAYGITTMPERGETFLKQSRESLARTGFNDPRFFVDDHHVGRSLLVESVMLSTCTVTRNPTIGPMGNWWLALWELFIRSPHADRYAIFQDDILACSNLREYLERWYPENGYLNLISFPENLQGIQPEDPRGWRKAPRRGKGGQGLVFDQNAIAALFSQLRMVRKFQELKNPNKRLDGAVREAMENAGITEWIHNPSLLYHLGAMGKTSIANNKKKQPLITSFPGEDFNLLDIERSEL